jgi:acyl-CoA synthetase (AMP-forming)/AMP-acid ligase II
LPSGWSIAKKLVFDKIKENLGLDQCELFFFSAAPLKESTRLFFLNLNIYLRNIYGMSELSGPQTTTNPKAFSNYHSIEALKEAGECYPGLELRISNPDADGNGEVCLRGRSLPTQAGTSSWATTRTRRKRGRPSTARGSCTLETWEWLAPTRPSRSPAGSRS